MLKNGWYVVFSNDKSGLIFFADQLEDLSKGGEGVHCSFEEHAMGSSAAFWRDGRCVWSVDREAGGPYAPLHIEGDPPPSFAERRARLFSMQEEAGGERAGVDYIYDLPIDLAEDVTGFSHRQALHPLGFEVLELERHALTPSPLPKKPWWKIW